MQGKNKTPAWMIVILIASALLCAYSLFTSIQKPMVMDEVNFFYQALLVSENGVPQDYALWHPPLYVFVVGNFTRLLNDSVLSARILGAILFVLNYFLALLIFRKLSKNDSSGSVVFSIIYFLSSYLIQQSVLVDIDTSLMPFFMLLFCYAFLSMKDAWRKYSLLSLVFFFILWTKFIPGIFAMCALFLFYAIKKEWFKAFVVVPIMSFASVVVFWLSWLLFSSWLGLDRYYFLNLLVHRFTYESSSAGIFQHVRLFGFSLLWALFWISLPVLLFALMFFSSRIKSFFEKWTVLDADYPLLLCAIMILFFYFARPAGPAVKYIYTLVSLIVVFASLWLTQPRKALSLDFLRRYRYNFLAIGAILFVFGFIFKIRNADYLIDAYLYSGYIAKEAFYHSLSTAPYALSVIGALLVLSSIIFILPHLRRSLEWKNAGFIAAAIIFVFYVIMGDPLLQIRSLNVFYLFLYLCPAVLFVLLCTHLESWRRIQTALLVLLVVAMSAPVLVHQSLSSYEVTVTWTNYGESGLKETASYLSEAMRQGERAIARHDVAFYADMDDNKDVLEESYLYAPVNGWLNDSYYRRDLRFYSHNFLGAGEEALPIYEYLLSSKNVKYVVLDQYANKGFSAPLVEKEFSLVAKIGDFDVYALKSR